MTKFAHEIPMRPCRACHALLLLWSPTGPPPPGMLIDGVVCVCSYCANIQLQTHDMRLRDLTADERRALRPETPPSERDARWEEIKRLHDQFVLDVMMRMSRNHNYG